MRSLHSGVLLCHHGSVNGDSLQRGSICDGGSDRMYQLRIRLLLDRFGCHLFAMQRRHLSSLDWGRILHCLSLRSILCHEWPLGLYRCVCQWSICRGFSYDLYNMSRWILFGCSSFNLYHLLSGIVLISRGERMCPVFCRLFSIVIGGTVVFLMCSRNIPNKLWCVKLFKLCGGHCFCVLWCIASGGLFGM